MKTYSIAITIDNRVTDVISYKAERRNPEKELELVAKFMNYQVCDVKSVEIINYRKIAVISKKDTTYMVTWDNVTLWDESELKD
jgi:2,3-bisphosphoglycerate-independent phosphoglycerate mutase